MGRIQAVGVKSKTRRDQIRIEVVREELEEESILTKTKNQQLRIE